MSVLYSVTWTEWVGGWKQARVAEETETDGERSDRERETCRQWGERDTVRNGRNEIRTKCVKR